MTERNKINMWGPTSLPAATPQPVDVPPSALPPVLSTEVDTKPIRKTRFGVWDVVGGFGAMLFLQVLIAFGAIAVLTAQAVSNGQGVEDVDALANEMIGNLTSSGPFLFLSALSMYVAWWFFARRASKVRGLGSYAKDFWLKFKWKRDIPIGIAFAVTFRLVEQGLYWLLGVLNVELNETGNSATITSQTGIWFFINAVLVASLLAPFFEEFFFRGLMLQGIMRSASRTRKKKKGEVTWLYKHRAAISVFVSSVIFGFMHFQAENTLNAWLVVIQTGLLGLVLALITLKTKRLGGAIIGHVLFNFSGVMLVLLLGSS